MRRVSLTTAILLSFCITAYAQDGQPQDGERRRGQGGPGGPGGPRNAWVGQMFDRMSFELQLDEQQQATFGTLRDQMREKMRDRMQGMRERWDEVRAAREAGDEEKARQLSDQLRSAGGPWDSIDEVFDQLQPSLRPDQVARLDTIRERVQDDREGWDRADRMRRELPDELQLTEEQRGQFRQMAGERMRTGFEERRPQMEAITAEIESARQNGDNEKLAALYAKLDEVRPNPDRGMQELLQQLEPILDEQQKQKLAEVREFAYGDGAAADSAKGGLDARSILKAARRAKLTSDQKEQLRAIEKDAMRSWREARGDKAVQAQLSQQLKHKIEELLTAEQRPAFDQQVEKLAKRAK